MPATPADGPAGDPAARLLGILHHLTVRACRSESLRELTFRILNDSVALAPYDRAVLWRLGRGRPRLLGVSGQQETNADTTFADEIGRLVHGLARPEEARVLAADDPADADAETWTRVAERTGGTAVLWLPIRAEGRLVGGLWLERWEGAAWAEDEAQMFRTLAEGYGAAWEKFALRTGPLGRMLGERIGWAHLAGAVAAVLLVLALVPCRLKVVAPCKVAPREPRVVAAPLEGVIAAVEVRPGQMVDAGTVLFRYHDREVREELEVARRQVRIVRARIERARTEAFEDDRLLGELAMLQHRLAQEEARLALAEENFERLVVRADAPGQALVERPEAREGRPVRVGERVLTLVDPAATEVRFWIAEADNVIVRGEAGDAAADTGVRVFLNVHPEESLPATLDYIAPSVAPSPDSIPSFAAKAQWAAANPPEVEIGLEGTAILYGPRVSVLYWMFRRPLVAVRRFLQI